MIQFPTFYFELQAQIQLEKAIVDCQAQQLRLEVVGMVWLEGIRQQMVVLICCY